MAGDQNPYKHEPAPHESPRRSIVPNVVLVPFVVAALVPIWGFFVRGGGDQFRFLPIFLCWLGTVGAVWAAPFYLRHVIEA